MNRCQYRKIAKKHKVSISDVKNDMQKAINIAYKNPNVLAKKVESEGEIPTPDEFIDYVSNKIIANKNKKI